MRGLPPETPETPYYDRIRAEEQRAERARDAEAEDDYDEMHDDPEADGRGRWRVYLIVTLAILALLVVAYWLAGYLFS